MTHLRSAVRTLLFTLLAFVALPGIGAFAQTTTYTYGFTNAGAFSNVSYTFGVPLQDADGNHFEMSIYEGNNAYTGAPYSRAQFNGGPYDGLTLNGTGWTTSKTTALAGFPNSFPPSCANNSCGTISGTFSGIDPSTGRTLTVTMDLQYHSYASGSGRGYGVRYELYGATVTASE